jgi:hypothetical protein
MNVKQEQRFESLEKSLVLLRSEKHLEPHVVPLVRDLAHTIDRVRRFDVDQLSASTARAGYPDYIKTRRRELYLVHMYQISRRGPELMKWGPKAEVALRLPHPSVGNPRLIAAAHAMATVVALKPSLFIKEAQFHKDFLAKLRAATRNLATVIDESKENTRRLKAATTALARELSHGRTVLRTLDGVLKARMHDDPGFADGWRAASRVPKRTGRPKAKKRKPGPPPGDS